MIPTPEEVLTLWKDEAKNAARLRGIANRDYNQALLKSQRQTEGQRKAEAELTAMSAEYEARLAEIELKAVEITIRFLMKNQLMVPEYPNENQE